MKQAIEGKGRTVFISGEAGSGKTRLTLEFLKAAMREGVAVMAGCCLSDSQVPYFPFMEAFNNYFAASGKGETARCSPRSDRPWNTYPGWSRKRKAKNNFVACGPKASRKS